MAIYIIRHGQTLWNLESRKQGHKDSPLTIKGISQAHNVCKILEKENIDFNKCELFVSPLFRAKQYAQIITETLGIRDKIQYEDLIKEHGFGGWEGLTQKEVDCNFPGESEIRKKDRWNYIIPGGGESYEIISQRAKCFLKRNQDPDKDIIMICHEMISKVTRGILLNLDQSDILDLGHPQDTIYKIVNTSLTPLT